MECVKAATQQRVSVERRVPNASYTKSPWVTKTPKVLKPWVPKEKPEVGILMEAVED